MCAKQNQQLYNDNEERKMTLNGRNSHWEHSQGYEIHVAENCFIWDNIVPWFAQTANDREMNPIPLYTSSLLLLSAVIDIAISHQFYQDVKWVSPLQVYLIQMNLLKMQHQKKENSNLLNWISNWREREKNDWNWNNDSSKKKFKTLMLQTVDRITNEAIEEKQPKACHSWRDFMPY